MLLLVYITLERINNKQLILSMKKIKNSKQYLLALLSLQMLIYICLSLTPHSRQHFQKQVAINIIQQEKQKLIQTFSTHQHSHTFSIAMKIYTMSNLLGLVKDQQNQAIQQNHRHSYEHLDQQYIKKQSIQCLNQLKDIVNQFKQSTWIDLFSQIYSDLKNLNQKCSNLNFEQVVGSSSASKFSSGLTNKCLLCTIVMRIVQNVVYMKSVHAANTVDYYVCDWFGGIVQKTCDGIVYYFGPNIITSIQNNQNPDVICRELSYCQQGNQCYLTDQNPSILKHRKHMLAKHLHRHNHRFNFEEQFNAPWEWIQFLFQQSFSCDHLSPFDKDNDTFSNVSTFRGYNWKGFDCDDNRDDVYPGRKMEVQESNDQKTDWDCNQIIGLDQYGQSLEKQMCDVGGTKRLGLGLLGDSAGANFQFPDKYLNASSINSSTFDDFIYNLYNEFDNPQISAFTGFSQKKSKFNSLYKSLKQWNECNQNDYQNVAVNGASSKNVINQIQKLKREKSDWPMLVILQLIGNDVCKSDLQYITTPEQFRDRIINFLSSLDDKLPAGSHLIIFGIAQGHKVYQTMANQMHPLYVTYERFYEYLNCLNVNPCKTWLNSDQNIRQKTAEKAKELNQIYKNIIQTTKFINFDIQYYDFPLDELLSRKIKQGGSGKDLISKTDGFHPNEQFNSYLGEWIWQKIKNDHIDWIGLKNPNNLKIKQAKTKST